MPESMNVSSSRAPVIHEFVDTAPSPFGSTTLPEIPREHLRIANEAINAPLTENWYDRPAIVGTGAYASAIGHRLSTCGIDVMLVGRNQSIAREIRESHTNSKGLSGRELSPALSATTSPVVGFLDRGVVVLAVPSLAFGSVLEGKTFHPDSIIVSMAKGLIIEGWDPLSVEDGLKKGPAIDSTVMTPLQFLRQHEATKNCKGHSVVSGPGFAADIVDNKALHLAVAASDKDVCMTVANLFKGGAIISKGPDTIGVEIAATMKNVIAIMVGVAHGLTKKYGSIRFPDNYAEVIKCLGMQEATKLAEHLGGCHRTFIGPSGYADLNLTTSSTTGRNYSLGLNLAQGGDIDAIVRGQGKIVEGAWSAWAVKRLSDDKGNRPGVYMPVTNALIDIFRHEVSPAVRVERLIEELSYSDFHAPAGWVSHSGIVQSYVPAVNSQF